MRTAPLFRNARLLTPVRWTVLAGLLVVGLARAEAAEPLFFIQLSDPQFGMFAANADLQQETANFEFAIATANRLKPAFVIVTGDLVNKAGDKAQADEYLRIAAKLDHSIPLYQLPGNHDIGNEPTEESIAAYVARFGPDHCSFRCGPILGLVLNSGLIQSAKAAPKQAEEQDAWLKAELEKAKRDGVRHVIVFQHHPWFIAKIDEPGGYHNLPQSARPRYLDLFRQFGVTHVFAGHHHANATAQYCSRKRCQEPFAGNRPSGCFAQMVPDTFFSDSLEMVTTGAIGKPLRNDVSGLRIVIVRDTGIEHRFYHLGEIPHRIDLSPPKKAPAAAPQKGSQGT